MKWFEEIQKIENIELYVTLVVFVFTLWFVFNTIKYYRGEKRKVKHLHRFAREGESISQYELAKRYAKGDMVKKSCQNAASLSQKAAFSGDEEAREFLDEILKSKRC
jgi:TPR repeat protein